jgi:hypothetical protein
MTTSRTTAAAVEGRRYQAIWVLGLGVSE